MFRNLLYALALIALAGCSNGDVAGGGPGIVDGSEDMAASDAGEITERVPDTSTGEGPSCYEALTCLVDLKNWHGGPVGPSESDCLEGISDTEMDDVDAYLGCVEARCSAEFVAFEAGGDAELDILYLCVMEKCAETTALCIGGQGQADCGDAIWCLADCDPYMYNCTTACIAETSEAQAEKTGKFLQCVLDVCPLAEVGTTCDVPTACALKCPEVI